MVTTEVTLLFVPMSRILLGKIQSASPRAWQVKRHLLRSWCIHHTHTNTHTHIKKSHNHDADWNHNWENWGKRNRAVTQPNTTEGNGRLPAQNVLMHTHGWKTCDLFVYLNVNLDITSYVIYLYRFYNIDCCDIILLK